MKNMPTITNKNKQQLRNILLLITVIYLASRIIIGFEYFAINKILANPNDIISNLWRWDSKQYESIAINGYDTFFDGKSSNWPFFPLWVIILKSFSLNGLLPIPIVGIMLNQALFCASLLALYLYLEKLNFAFNDIIFGIFIIAISPANIYFCSGLTENLFLFLSICAFYFLQTDNKAGYLICGALLSATRITGIFFILPMLYHIYISKRLTLKTFIIYPLICASGLLLFMLYMHVHTGSALSFLEVQSKVAGWVRPGLTFDSNIIDQVYEVIAIAHIYDRTIFLIGFLLITFILYKKGFIKEALFNFCCTLPALISASLWNSFRYDTAIFTFYIGIMLIPKFYEVARYLLFALLVVMSFICWFYWLGGSWYFA